MSQPVDRISSFANGIRQISAYFWLLQSLGPVSRKSRKLFGHEKPFVKLRPAYSVRLILLYVVKRIIITEKLCASTRLRFEDTKTIMSPEILLIEKRAWKGSGGFWKYNQFGHRQLSLWDITYAFHLRTGAYPTGQFWLIANAIARPFF